MAIAKEDIPLIRPWLIKKSGELSESDPTILADYILFLLNNRLEGQEMVNLLEEQLEEFTEKNKELAKVVCDALASRSFVAGEAEIKKLLDPEEQKKQLTKEAIELTTQIYKIDKTSYRTAPPDYKRKISNKFRQQSHPAIKQPAPPGIAELEEERRKAQTQLESVVDGVNATTNRGKTVIVSNLPFDKLEEGVIRSYFSRYGELESVKLTPGTRIAELEFKEHKSAKSCWSSPTPIFDNRFIKVFFKKNSDNGDANEVVEEPQQYLPEPEEPFDAEAFKLQQIEKQKEFEAKKAQKEQFNSKLKQLIALKEKLLGQFEEKLRDLETQLINQPELEAEIKVKLENIQKEMTDTGVTPYLISQDRAKLEGRANFSSLRGSVRGRGGYRGGRGARTNPYSRPVSKGGPNRKLDLRTRTIILKNFTDFNNEVLQQFIKASIGEENIEANSVKDFNDLSITFRDRYFAERFFKFYFKLTPDSDPIGKEWDESVRPTSSAGDVSAVSGNSTATDAVSATSSVTEPVDENADVSVGL